MSEFYQIKQMCYNINTPIARWTLAQLHNQLNITTILTNPELALSFACDWRPRNWQAAQDFLLLKGRPKMSKATEGERIRRDRMFQQGMLWCAGHKQFEPIKGFRKYNPKAKPQTNYGYRYYCKSYETQVQNPNRAERHSKFFKERNLDLKKFWVELAGGKCQRCGFGEFTSALEFHHVYPALKKGNPATMIFNNNKEKAWKELDKCCLLCSICHRAHKAREWQAEFIKRPDALGWTVGSSLPLDDTRYETEKPPKYQQAAMPLFNYEQRASQLTLFAGVTI